MSRIGRQPVDIPTGVFLEASSDSVRVKGPKGELSIELRPEVAVAVEGKQAKVTAREETRAGRAFHGMTRALIQNMVVGVTKGYEKTMEIQEPRKLPSSD